MFIFFIFSGISIIHAEKKIMWLSLFTDLEHLKWHWNYPLLQFEDFIIFRKNYLDLGGGGTDF